MKLISRSSQVFFIFLIFFQFSLYSQNVLNHVWDGYRHSQSGTSLTPIKNDNIYISVDDAFLGPNMGALINYNLVSNEVDTNFPCIDGHVHDMIDDSLGGYFVVGEFSVINYPNLNNFCRINYDGSIDTSWDIRITRAPRCINIHNNTLYIGGLIDSVGNQFVNNNIIKINLATKELIDWPIMVDNDFTPINNMIFRGDTLITNGYSGKFANQSKGPLNLFNVNNNTLYPFDFTFDKSVTEILVFKNYLYVTGNFTYIFGSPNHSRNYFCSFDLITGEITNWSPSVNHSSTKQMVGFENDIYITGKFDTVNGESRRSIASVNYLTGNNSPFELSIQTLYNNFEDASTNSIQIIGDTILIAGKFEFGSQSKHMYLVKADKNTGQIFNHEHDINEVGNIVKLKYYNNKVFLLGLNSLSRYGKRYNGIIEVDLITGKPTTKTFHFPGDSLGAANIIKLIDNNLFVTTPNIVDTITGEKFKQFSQVNINTGLWTGLSLEFRSNTNLTVKFRQYNDKMYFFGSFNEIEGIERKNFAIYDLSTNTVLKDSINFNGTVNDVLLYKDKIFFQGTFYEINNINQRHFAAFNTESLDLLPFSPLTPNPTIESIKGMSLIGNKLYLIGRFDQILGQTRHSAVTIDANTLSILPQNFSLERQSGSIPSCQILDVYGNILFIEGGFDLINGLPSDGFEFIDTKTGQPVAFGHSYSGTIEDKYFVEYHSNSGLPYFKHKYLRIHGNIPSEKVGYITGTSILDLNQNCTHEDTDSTIANVLIQVNGINTYFTTNSNGDFIIPIDTGFYQIKQVKTFNQGVLLDEICSPSQVHVKEYGEIYSDNNFYNSMQQCEHLDVGIASTRFLRCFPGKVTIDCSNHGIIPSGVNQLHVKFPEHIIPISSSVPWSLNQNGSLTFDITSIQPNDSKTIVIYDSVACDDNLGLPQCITANLIDEQNCISYSNTWDNSDIKIKSNCTLEGAQFIISNTGIGNMTDSLEYRIFSSDTLIFVNKYLLNSSDSIIINLNDSKSIYRIEADQNENHPYESYASTFTSDCLTELTIAQQAYISQFSNSSNNNLQDNICQKIVGSYDPNDKTNTPSGKGANNDINHHDLINYLIRFQNTGTDTAFTVYVTDTLSNYLDISSFKFHAASHDYSYEILDGINPILLVKFNNINLPDSSVNQLESNGYFNFSCLPKQDLAIGTAINNSANIYFDYNDPIITNTVYNTISAIQATDFNKGNALINEFVLSSYEDIKPTFHIIYPNPMCNEFMISGQYDLLTVLDINGRIIYETNSSKTDENKVITGLENGIYIVNIYHNKTVSTLKLISQCD